jgi:hypothetical protein
MKQVQAAVHRVTEAAESDGRLLFARIAMMQAINRHKQAEFDRNRRSPKLTKTKAQGANDRLDYLLGSCWITVGLSPASDVR